MDEAYERKADELEQEADRLETASDAVGKQVKELREDWDQKKSGNIAPGAAEPEEAAPGGLGEQEEQDSDSG